MFEMQHRLLEEHKRPVPLRRSLVVGRRDDPAEREADRVANAVVARPPGGVNMFAAGGGSGSRIRPMEPARQGQEMDRGKARLVAAGESSDASPASAGLGFRIRRMQGTVATVQRVITDTTVLAELARFFKGECDKFGLSTEDKACKEILQKAISTWDDGDLEFVKTLVGGDLVMLAASGGHTNVGTGVTAAATKDEALARNRKEQQRLRQLIADGVASVPADEWGTRWKNTCEWIEQGVAGVTVHTVTLAHDTAQRMQGPGALGWYFPDENEPGSDVLSTKDHTYSDDVNKTDGLSLGETKGTEAGAIDGKIIFYGSDRFSDEHLKRTLVHEVQHIADRSAADITYWKKTDVAEMCFARYKTEYRAHWYEGTFDATSSTETVSALGYQWTARQYEIFQQIHTAYDHTKLAWDFSNVTDWNVDKAESAVASQHSPKASGDYANPGAGSDVRDVVDTFRSAIVTYQNPDTEGANKFNSPRLNALYDHLQQPAADDIVIADINAVTDEEWAFVLQSKAYANFEQLWRLTQNAEPAAPRFDGLYRSATRKATDGSDCWRYVRLYPDGLVLAETVASQDLHAISKWFHRGGHASRGQYTVEGVNIKFTIATPSGSFPSRGQIGADLLELDSDQYTFLQL